MCLLTFSFYMLAEHPDIERRLRHEIFETVGPSGTPTYDQMRDMKFMRAFLNGISVSTYRGHSFMRLIYLIEVLRLYPPVYVDLHTAQ
jgi:cytochrome P450